MEIFKNKTFQGGKIVITKKTQKVYMIPFFEIILQDAQDVLSVSSLNSGYLENEKVLKDNFEW